MFESIAELLDLAENSKKDLHEIIIEREMASTNKSYDKVMEGLNKSLTVMKQSLEKGLKIDMVLPIGEAMEQSQKMQAKPFFLSKDIKEAVYWAMSIMEYNNGMGVICAAPTAGSCGVFPATILKGKEMLNKTDEQLMHAFIVGSAVGVICGNRATLSGSEAGCQAEVGVASTMAAAALTYMAGGQGKYISNAVALALKNLLGLVCDPVGGLVISPCIKRNAIGVMNAFLAAEMALSGVTSIIPADEVIDAMMEIGRQLPSELRETGKGGVAATPTGKRIADSLYKNQTK